MRITLDYYRILSVPIKADSQQLSRAYEDRLKQQARREYSSLAIAARKKLLQQAYAILGDADLRAEYDGSFFAPSEFDSISLPAKEEVEVRDSEQPIVTAKPIAVNPHIEIEPEILVGALMVFYELAEYEMVLNLGHDYLEEKQESCDLDFKVVENSNNGTATLKKADPTSDIVLSLALSYLELSREQWRREEWEQAASSGQKGLELLQQEDKPIFFNLQAEIESELNLLKPYRVLDLLANNESNSSLKQKGLELLQEMLLQRDGIEGNQNDPFGLTLDRFLCFIQQIRTYLTLQEQKELFLAEARRGSHPGSYVAAYSLIAEGYAYKKPSSIVRAKQIFQDLSRDRNTHWERAICALLLGRTAEAQEVVEKTQEAQTIELIKKRSQNSPDLLPGIYFYGEQWLKTDVLSQFNDLKDCQISLSAYFNDPSVQAYLNKISPVAIEDEPNVTSGSFESSVDRQSHEQSEISHRANTNSRQQHRQEQNRATQPKIVERLPWWIAKKITNNGDRSKTKTDRVKLPQTASTSVGAQASNNSDRASQYDYEYRERELTQNAGFSDRHKASVATIYASDRANNSDRVRYSQQQTAPTKTKTLKRKRKVQNKAQKSYGKSWLLALGLICGVGALGFAFTNARLQSQSQQQIERKTAVQPIVEPDKIESKPTIEETVEKPTTTGETPTTTATAAINSEKTAKPTANTTVLNLDSAHTAIQKWLDSKAAALGKEYQSERLNSVLTTSLLNQWRDRSNYYKQHNIHRQFEHTLTIRQVKIDPKNSNLATVEAEVKEVAHHYQKGQLNQAQSYNDDLIVRYQLVRQNDSWLIQNSQVIRSL